MSDLRSQLRPASYKGFAFDVQDDSSSFGRRVETHEYPGRDEPAHEDLGLGVQEFTVEAVIFGREYLSLAAQFETLLKESGPGVLVHPHYGEIEVIALQARRRHSTERIGEIAFSITFQKYGRPLYPTQAKNTQTGLTVASDETFSALNSDFSSFFRTSSIPDFILEDSQARAELLLSQTQAVLSNAGLGNIIQWPVNLSVQSSGFADDIIGLFSSLAAAAQPPRLPVVGGAKTASVTNIPDLVYALSEASTKSVRDTSPVTTASRSVRVKNAESLDYLNRLSSLSAAVRTLRYAPYESREQALDIRNNLVVRINTLQDLLGASGWDESWRAAGSLVAALTRDINERIGRLPKTTIVRPATIRSSLALANRLYGDNPASIISQASDMADRNKVRHPGFMPAEDLEVLIDA